MDNEFIDDLHNRLNIPLNILAYTTDGFWFNCNKANRKSWKRMQFHSNPVSELYKCDYCGKLGTKRKVNSKEQCVHMFDMEYKRGGYQHKTLTCMSCFNKLKPIAKAVSEIYEIHFLIQKLKKEANKWQKLQKQAN